MIIGDLRSNTVDVPERFLESKTTSSKKSSIKEDKQKTEHRRVMNRRLQMLHNVVVATENYLETRGNLTFGKDHVQRIYSAWAEAISKAVQYDEKEALLLSREEETFKASLPKHNAQRFLANFVRETKPALCWKKFIEKIPKDLIRAFGQGYFLTNITSQEAAATNLLWDAMAGSIFFLHCGTKGGAQENISCWSSYLHSVSYLMQPPPVQNDNNTRLSSLVGVDDRCSSVPFSDKDLKTAVDGVLDSNRGSGFSLQPPIVVGSNGSEVEALHLKQGLSAQACTFSYSARFRVRSGCGSKLRRHLGLVREENVETANLLLPLLMFGGVTSTTNVNLVVCDRSAYDAGHSLGDVFARLSAREEIPKKFDLDERYAKKNAEKGLHPLLFCPAFGARRGRVGVDGKNRQTSSSCTVVVRMQNGSVSSSLFGSFDAMWDILREPGLEKASFYEILRRQRCFSNESSTEELKALEKSASKRELRFVVQEARNPGFSFPLVYEMQRLLIAPETMLEQIKSQKFLGWTELTPLRALYLSVMLTSFIEISMLHFFVCQSKKNVGGESTSVQQKLLRRGTRSVSTWIRARGVHKVTLIHDGGKAKSYSESIPSASTCCERCLKMSRVKLEESISKALYESLVTTSAHKNHSSATSRNIFFLNQAKTCTSLFVKRLRVPIRIPSGDLTDHQKCLRIVQGSDSLKTAISIPLYGAQVFSHCFEKGVLDPSIRGPLGRTQGARIVCSTRDQGERKTIQAWLTIPTPIVLPGGGEKNFWRATSGSLSGYIEIFHSRPKDFSPTEIHFLQETQEGEILYKNQPLFRLQANKKGV